ncbi:MAG: aspartyl protease family protein [Coriobacteriia bacterium]|nr:aspartyl protease family protein [Coriobacteriia bacterium]
MERTRGAYTERLLELKDRLKQNQGAIPVAYDYAEKLFQLGHFAESKELLTQLSDGGVSHPEALFLLGRIAYLFGDYPEAEALYKTLADQFIEFKDKAGSELSAVYYQMNRYEEIRELNLPDDPDSENSTSKIHHVLGDRVPYQVHWSGAEEVATVPFKATNPLPLIQIELRGKPHNFIIDTGASDTILDHALVEALGIQVYGQGSGMFAGGTCADVMYGLLDSLTLGSIRIDTLPVMLLPSSTIAELSGVYKNRYPISGLIGIGIFKQFLTTMDYPAKCLVLRPKGATVSQGDSAIELPFVLAASHMIISRGLINGKDMNIFFDSGLAASLAILLPSDSVRHAEIPVLKTMKVDASGGGGVAKIDIDVFRVASFKLGDLPEGKRLLGASGIFPEQLYFDDKCGFFIDALISHQYLKSYTWTIDFDSMKMSSAKGKKQSWLRRFA